MRKGLTYLLVLLGLLYGLFLLVQAGGIENRVQPATHHLVRIGQLDPGQYATAQEYQTWAYSTCSAAAMTEVANYYGRNYRITDILAVEAGIGEITPEQGLLEDAGIARTMKQFGFVTSWGYILTLDQVVTLADGGTPVIVAFPPSRYPGGHLLVITGGDGARVLVADSSIYNRTSFSRKRFLELWAGFTAVVTPQGG
jgi:predicted double-glycine peptidase